MKSTATLDEVLRPTVIRAAWEKVRSNRGAAGEDSVTIAELEGCFDRYWPGIERSVRAGDYKPAPLRPVSIPKPSGGTRTLAIPSVTDRIIQQSIAACLAARWEPLFPPCSFAYRPGIGAAQALDAAMAAAGGFASPVALRFDIKDFFDTVPHPLCACALAATPCDASLGEVAMRAISAPMASPFGPVARNAGIPQGSPLSPVMANMVLLPFDTEMQSSGGCYIRYADDMMVLCSGRDEAFRRLERAAQALARLGLRPNETKTDVCALSEAEFLGCGFHFEQGMWVRRLPRKTLDACRGHLLSLADDGHPVGTLRRFLRQWAAYFLPSRGDRQRHARFFDAMRAEFRLDEPGDAGFDPGGDTRGSSMPPPGFQYDGRPANRHDAWNKAAWAGRFLLRRVRFGITFRRRGFVPVPSGLWVNLMGHRVFIRF